MYSIYVVQYHILEIHRLLNICINFGQSAVNNLAWNSLGMTHTQLCSTLVIIVKVETSLLYKLHCLSTGKSLSKSSQFQTTRIDIEKIQVWVIFYNDSHSAKNWSLVSHSPNVRVPNSGFNDQFSLLDDRRWDSTLSFEIPRL